MAPQWVVRTGFAVAMASMRAIPNCSCTVRVEMLGSTRHSVGQLGCALLAAALNPEKDQTRCAGNDDQNHNHCDDDGGHNLAFQTVS